MQSKKIPAAYLRTGSHIICVTVARQPPFSLAPLSRRESKTHLHLLPETDQKPSPDERDDDAEDVERCEERDLTDGEEDGADEGEGETADDAMRGESSVNISQSDVAGH